MKGMPGLICVVLDEGTALTLRGFTARDNVKCQHVTMAYRPTPEVYAKYEELLGQTIEFELDTIVCDDKAQVVTVKGVPSENEVPHITMSVACGMQSSYSNTLLVSQDTARWDVSLKLPGKGTVQFVRL